MKQIINGKVYDTKTAELVASNDYWDGSNFDRNGRNAYLYKTSKGNYFVLRTSRWQGERDYIAVLSVGDAKALYERLPEHYDTEYKDVFGVEPEEG